MMAQGSSQLFLPFRGDVITGIFGNVCSWDETGQMNGKNTSFNDRDAERAENYAEKVYQKAQLPVIDADHIDPTAEHPLDLFLAVEDWNRLVGRTLSKKFEDARIIPNIHYGPINRGFQVGLDLLKASDSRALQLLAQSPIPPLLIGALANFPTRGLNEEQVLEYLIRMDQSKNHGRFRRGASRIASSFFDKRLVKPLLTKLKKTLRNKKIFGSGETSWFGPKLRVVNFRFIGWDRSEEMDRHANKGILEFTTELPSGREVLIYVAHMQQIGPERAGKARSKQFEQMIDIIKETNRGQKRPIIVAGDMNVLAKSLSGAVTNEYLDMKKFMKRVGLRNIFSDEDVFSAITFREKETAFGKATKRDARGIEGCLDYVYVSEDFDIIEAYILQEEFEGDSDHYPLFFKLFLGSD